MFREIRHTGCPNVVLQNLVNDGVPLLENVIDVVLSDLHDMTFSTPCR